MEWDLKASPWDLPELEREDVPSISSAVISSQSSSLGRQKNGLDCSVDLKLGGLGDFGSSDKWKGQPRGPLAATAMVSSSGSSKRARSQISGSLSVSCLVDGCKSDLSTCRDYHRKHKVCEAHSKTPMVLVGGQEQRFCQQCSRFHLLVEFDEVKRSCRKRLDGHNRRRRKPQPDPMSSGNLFAAHQDPSWSSAKTENALYRQHEQLHFIDRQHIPGSYFRSYKDGKQFPFLQDDNAAISSRTAVDPSVCQPLLNTISSESSNRKMFPDGLNQVLDSDCALSLLSSPTQTSGINQGHIVPADQIPMAQPLVQSLPQYDNMGRYTRSQASNNVSPTGFSCSRMENEQVSTVLVSDASDADLQCHGIFHVGSDGSSHGPSQALPFSWQ